MKLAMVILALVARDAYASRSCGGSSGGGGSSSSGGGGGGGGASSSSSSSDSTSSTPACIDDTDVVGYKQCTKFGHAWGVRSFLPRFSIEVGTNVRQFSGTASGTGSVWHGAENFAFRMVTPPAQDATAVASTVRIGFGLPHGLYTGIEGELGGLTGSSSNFQMSDVGTYGTPDVTQRTAVLFGGAAYVGARISSGRASLSIEGAGGVRSVRYRATSTYHNCVDTAIVTATQGILEARARAELWLNPWFTVGAQAGANVLAQGDWMTGAFIGIHSRAFGGRH